MIAKSSYTHPRPLSRAHAQELLAHPDAAERIRAAFLCFVVIPVKESIGEWRFAGIADTLVGAFHRIESFGRGLGRGRRSLLDSWLDDEAPLEGWTALDKSWSYRGLPLDEIGKHRDPIRRRPGPYDHIGCCILEVPSLARSHFAARVLENQRPDTWPTDDEGD